MIQTPIRTPWWTLVCTLFTSIDKKGAYVHLYMTVYITFSVRPPDGQPFPRELIQSAQQTQRWQRSGGHNEAYVLETHIDETNKIAESTLEIIHRSIGPV